MLSFKAFQTLNKLRCNERFEANWPIENWSLAIAGEAGELCNLVKKVIRGDFPLAEVRQQILYEIADVMTYCDLAMTCLEAETEEELMRKFYLVSGRVNWPVTVSHCGGIEANHEPHLFIRGDGIRFLCGG